MAFIGEKKKDVRGSGHRCAVNICKNNRRIGNYRWFKFPSIVEQFNIWALKCKSDMNKNKKKLVCEMHFETKYLTKKYLPKNAIPTLFLDENNERNKNNLSKNEGIYNRVEDDLEQLTSKTDLTKRENCDLTVVPEYIRNDANAMPEADVEIKPDICNFVPVQENYNIDSLSTIEIKTEKEDPLHPFNEGYYFIQCKCSVLVKRSDKSVQCNLYEEQIEPNQILISNIEENNNNNKIDIDSVICNDNKIDIDTVICNDNKIDIDTVICNDNDVTVDNIITYSSISESSEDEAKFEELFTKTEKIYEEAYTMVDGGYKCNKCNKISDNRCKFLRHSVSHLEHSTLCYGCGKISKRNQYHSSSCPNLKKKKIIETKYQNDINEYGYKKQKRNSFKITQCKDCGNTIRSELEGNDHQNIHENLKPYICSCGSKCRFFHNFITHLKKFKCPVDKCIIPQYAPQNIQLWVDGEAICQRTSTNLKKTESKNKTKKIKIEKKKLPDSELNCKECGIDKFLNYVRYREHLESKHLERKFECKVKRCGRKFPTERRLRDHVKNIHLIQHKCEKCNFAFSRSMFRKHITTSCSGLNNEKITVSNYKTIFRNQLFHCSICNEYEEYRKIKEHFTKLYHKKLEKTWKEKYNIKKYECTKCSTKFSSINIYNFFKHLEKLHKYCFIVQINDIFKSFENNERFIFNVEDSNLKNIIIIDE